MSDRTFEVDLGMVHPGIVQGSILTNGLVVDLGMGIERLQGWVWERVLVKKNSAENDHNSN